MYKEDIKEILKQIEKGLQINEIQLNENIKYNRPVIEFEELIDQRKGYWKIQELINKELRKIKDD